MTASASASASISEQHLPFRFPNTSDALSLSLTTPPPTKNAKTDVSESRVKKKKVLVLALEYRAPMTCASGKEGAHSDGDGKSLKPIMTQDSRLAMHGTEWPATRLTTSSARAKNWSRSGPGSATEANTGRRKGIEMYIFTVSRALCKTLAVRTRRT